MKALLRIFGILYFLFIFGVICVPIAGGEYGAATAFGAITILFPMGVYFYIKEKHRREKEQKVRIEEERRIKSKEADQRIK